MYKMLICKGFKYLKEKPSDLFTDGQFLQIIAAEAEGLVNCLAYIDAEDEFRSDVGKCIINDYVNDYAKAWNEERQKIAIIVLETLLFPYLVKWLKETLAAKATDYILTECSKNLFDEVNVRLVKTNISPFVTKKKNQNAAVVMGLSFGDGERNSSTYGAVLDKFGVLNDYIKLDHIQDYKGARQNDLSNLSEFIKEKSVDLIVISGWTPATKTRLFQDIRKLVDEGNQFQRWNKEVELYMIDDQVARIFMDSKRSLQEFPDKDAGSRMIRYCISLARRAQDPTMEIAGLVNKLNEIKLLRLHPLQNLVPEDRLLFSLQRVLVDVVNKCGVDVNLAAMYPHKAHSLQFVSGLGPRKAQAFLTKIQRLGGKIDSRNSLVKEHFCQSQIFMNCSAFIRIRRYHFQNRKRGDEMWDILDDTRIHPENYDLARKMASDSIEAEEQLEEGDNLSLHVIELMEGDVDRLDLLLLDDYAEELERSLGEPKKTCLSEIKSELKGPYR